jgi:hypothetical protein
MKGENKGMKDESVLGINRSGSEPAQKMGDVGGNPQDHNRNTTAGEDLYRQAQDMIGDEPQDGYRRYQQKNG